MDYVSDMAADPAYQWQFNERVFACRFAKAAHEHGIRFHDNVLAIDLTAAQQEERRQYNMYYGTAKLNLVRYLRRKENGKPEKEVPIRRPSSGPMPKPRLYPGPSSSEDRANAARVQLAKLAGDSPKKPEQLHLPGFIPAEVIRFIKDLHARFDKKPHR